MDFQDIQQMDHLAISSPLSLTDCCSIAQNALHLPPFELDSENESEWGIAVKDGIEYNISRPYEAETLRDWDPTVPEGFNIGVTLMFSEDSTWSANAFDAMAEQVGRTLASAFGTTVVHHRTWLEAGNNVPRNRAFYPGTADE
jgi:hypothetical protein